MKSTLSQTLWVSLGSAIGASARWGIGLAQSGAEEALVVPWSTLAVNVAGSTLIGFYAATAGANGSMRASEAQRLFVMAGFCGGFTTFSLFSAEVRLRLQAGDTGDAGVLLLVSSLAWLAGAWIGYRAGQHLASGRARRG